MKKSFLLFLQFSIVSFSLNSSAQDYFITFAGTGASSDVSIVEVENLATGKTLTINGGDILHLTSVVGISQLVKLNSSSIRIYPNPVMGNSIISLQSPEAGNAVITVYEMTGKTIAQVHTFLENSRQDFSLSGLKNGMYLINVTGNSYQYSGKILSRGEADGIPGIEKVSCLTESKIEKNSKKEFNVTQNTVDMNFTEGDRLKFKAISGIYSTVKTDIPTEDKILTFKFIQCTDGDNISYPIVEIGPQTWMTENLRTTKSNDGIDCPLVTDNEEWTTLYPFGYCWYKNDSATYSVSYGALYNWNTVKNGRLCPLGWHVPSDEEWTELTDYLGGESIAGAKLKETGATHWYDPNTETTNETGFSALPGGYRYGQDGTFISIGAGGYWWSSSEYSSFTAWFRYLNFYNNLYRDQYYFNEQNGFSVRCLKD